MAAGRRGRTVTTMSALTTWLDPLPVEAFRCEHLGWRPLYRPSNPARRAWAASCDRQATDLARQEFAAALHTSAAAVDAEIVSAPARSVRARGTIAADMVAVQLDGWARWRIAPGGGDPDGFMPGEEHRLEPGAVLYVPAGWSYEATSGATSAALVIRPSTPAPLDAVMAVVRDHLVRQRRWPSRALALWDAERRARTACAA